MPPTAGVTRENVHGVDMDTETRCAHYGTERDVVALRFGCCSDYYACYKCHRELADHDGEPWPATEREASAVLCGVCETTLTAREYIAADSCPNCEAAFNPGCASHYGTYFEWIE